MPVKGCKVYSLIYRLSHGKGEDDKKKNPVVIGVVNISDHMRNPKTNPVRRVVLFQCFASGHLPYTINKVETPLRGNIRVLMIYLLEKRIYTFQDGSGLVRNVASGEHKRSDWSPEHTNESYELHYPELQKDTARRF